MNVTDRQTDRQTDGRTTYNNNTALALRASRGKKVKCPVLHIALLHDEHMLRCITDFSSGTLRKSKTVFSLSEILMKNSK